MTPAPIRYFIKSLTLIPILLCRQLSKLMPRDNNKVCIGAWFGNLYADNPKYFAEYLLENSEYEITWIGNDCVKSVLPKHPRLRFARKGSWSATRALLRARFWISCISYPHDLTGLPIDGSAICIDLWHGIPIKRVGRITAINENIRKSFIGGILLRLEEIYARIISGENEWLTVSSEEMARIQLKGYPSNFLPDRILRIGTPRNDFLVKNKNNTSLQQHLRRKYAKLLDFNPSDKIVLYLPTWRATGKDVFCFYNCCPSDRASIKQLMDEHAAVLIEKHHIHTYEMYMVPECNGCSIPIRNNQLQSVDTQELLLISDILISDYSSVYLDFALLSRPIIHYAYDYHEYKASDMGLCYDLCDVAGGEVVLTLGELLASLSNCFCDNAVAPKDKMTELIRYETGQSSERIHAFMNKQAKLLS